MQSIRRSQFRVSGKFRVEGLAWMFWAGSFRGKQIRCESNIIFLETNLT